MGPSPRGGAPTLVGTCLQICAGTLAVSFDVLFRRNMIPPCDTCVQMEHQGPQLEAAVGPARGPGSGLTVPPCMFFICSIGFFFDYFVLCLSEKNYSR